jgi:hypothetical protein
VPPAPCTWLGLVGPTCTVGLTAATELDFACGPF